ncbi:MAG: hypothetical protein WC700_07630 [Gemmatimonadaceae bacterium]|jgi:hypothetical protein
MDDWIKVGGGPGQYRMPSVAVMTCATVDLTLAFFLGLALYGVWIGDFVAVEAITRFPYAAALFRLTLMSDDRLRKILRCEDRWDTLGAAASALVVVARITAENNTLVTLSALTFAFSARAAMGLLFGHALIRNDVL